MQTLVVDFVKLDRERSMVWSIEASDLGMPAGEWPTTLTVKLPSGATRIFARHNVVRDRENDVSYVVYKRTAADNAQQFINVFND